MRMSELRKRESLWSIILFVVIMVSISKSHIFLSLTEIWISDIVIIVGSNFTICFFSFFRERGLSKLCLFLCIKFSFNFFIFFFLVINYFFLLGDNNRRGNWHDNWLGNWDVHLSWYLFILVKSSINSSFLFLSFISILACLRGDNNRLGDYRHGN
jgi:hypothetical protein